MQAGQFIVYYHIVVRHIAHVPYNDRVGNEFTVRHHPAFLVGFLDDIQLHIDIDGLVRRLAFSLGGLGLAGVIGIVNRIRLRSRTVQNLSVENVVAGYLVGRGECLLLAHCQRGNDLVQTSQFVVHFHIRVRNIAIVLHGDGVGDRLAPLDLLSILVGGLGHRQLRVEAAGIVGGFIAAFGGLRGLRILRVDHVVALRGYAVQDLARLDIVAGYDVGRGEYLLLARRQRADALVQVGQFIVHLHIVERHIAIVLYGDGVGDRLAQRHIHAFLVGSLGHRERGIDVVGLVRRLVSAFRGLRRFGILRIGHVVALCGRTVQNAALENIIAGYNVGRGECLLIAHFQNLDGLVQVGKRVVYLYIRKRNVAFVLYGDGVGDRLAQRHLFAVLIGGLGDLQLRVEIFGFVVGRFGIGIRVFLRGNRCRVYHFAELDIIAGHGVFNIHGDGCVRRKRCNPGNVFFNRIARALFDHGRRQIILHGYVVQRHIAAVGHDDGVLNRLAECVLLRGIRAGLDVAHLRLSLLGGRFLAGSAARVLRLLFRIRRLRQFAGHRCGVADGAERLGRAQIALLYRIGIQNRLRVLRARRRIGQRDYDIARRIIGLRCAFGQRECDDSGFLVCLGEQHVLHNYIADGNAVARRRGDIQRILNLVAILEYAVRRGILNGLFDGQIVLRGFRCNFFARVDRIHILCRGRNFIDNLAGQYIFFRNRVLHLDDDIVLAFCALFGGVRLQLFDGRLCAVCVYGVVRRIVRVGDNLRICEVFRNADCLNGHLCVVAAQGRVAGIGNRYIVVDDVAGCVVGLAAGRNLCDAETLRRRRDVVGPGIGALLFVRLRFVSFVILIGNRRNRYIYGVHDFRCVNVRFGNRVFRGNRHFDVALQQRNGHSGIFRIDAVFAFLKSAYRDVGNLAGSAVVIVHNVGNRHIGVIHIAGVLQGNGVGDLVAQPRKDLLAVVIRLLLQIQLDIGFFNVGGLLAGVLIDGLLAVLPAHVRGIAHLAGKDVLLRHDVVCVNGHDSAGGERRNRGGMAVRAHVIAFARNDDCVLVHHGDLRDFHGAHVLNRDYKRNGIAQFVIGLHFLCGLVRLNLVAGDGQFALGLCEVVVVPQRNRRQRVGECIVAFAHQRLRAGDVVSRAFAVRKSIAADGNGRVGKRLSVVFLGIRRGSQRDFALGDGDMLLADYVARIVLAGHAHGNGLRIRDILRGDFGRIGRPVIAVNAVFNGQCISVYVHSRRRARSIRLAVVGLCNVHGRQGDVFGNIAGFNRQLARFIAECVVLRHVNAGSVLHSKTFAVDRAVVRAHILAGR